ncbi:hypothetical protein KKB99_03810 [bacterium]|nr:hypothetical protein [bacterium]MBU1025118.1 hypothetical protein [bacterium]
MSNFSSRVLLVLVILLIACSGCIKPKDILSKGIADVDDLVVFATAAPDNILVYSVNKGKMEHSLPADTRLNDMAVAKKGDIAYVVTKNGWLNVFNIKTGHRTGRVRIGTVLQSVALSADEKYLAIGVGSEEDYNAHDISIRATDDIGNEILHLPLRGDIQDLVANPVTPELYILNTNADKVRVFDFNEKVLTGIVALGGSPSTLTVSPDGKKIYATLNARSAVQVIDANSHENLVRHELPGSAPHYVAFSPDGKQAAITDREKFRIYFIDNQKDEILGYKNFPDYLKYSLYPEIIAWSSESRYLYIVSSTHSDFRVIDTKTMQMVQNYSLPKSPSAMHIILHAENTE